MIYEINATDFSTIRGPSSANNKRESREPQALLQESEDSVLSGEFEGYGVPLNKT